MVSGFTRYVSDYELVFLVPRMVIFKRSSWIISPYSTQSERNASSLPTCVCVSFPFLAVFEADQL